jgi:hypothetical protein
LNDEIDCDALKDQTRLIQHATGDAARLREGRQGRGENKRRDEGCYPEALLKALARRHSSLITRDRAAWIDCGFIGALG